MRLRSSASASAARPALPYSLISRPSTSGDSGSRCSAVSSEPMASGSAPESSASFAASESSCTARAGASASVASAAQDAHQLGVGGQVVRQSRRLGAVHLVGGNPRAGRARAGRSAARLSASCFSWMVAIWPNRRWRTAASWVRLELLQHRGHLALVIAAAAVVAGERLGDLRRAHARRREPLEPAQHHAGGDVLREQLEEEARRLLRTVQALGVQRA